MSLRRRPFPGLLFLMASLSITQHEARADAPSAPLWEQLLWWLPEDTETLIVVPGPFEVPGKAEQFKFQEAVHLLATGPVLGLKDGIFRKDLLGQKVLCAVEGSRRFIPPTGLGMTRYQGCHILHFEAAADGALQKAFRTCQEKADKKLELAGQQIAVLTEKHEKDLWSYFVAHPRPGVLICATDQRFLEETLKRMVKRPEKRAVPADLPEWKHVDVKARIWAIRHYRKESADKDPSSPLRPADPDIQVVLPDPAAVGFVFWYSPDSRDGAHARYLSGAKDALDLVTKRWHDPSQRPTPEIRQIAAGVVEIATSVADQGTAHMFLFAIMAYLGHGIYL